jgi:hypothetical protein
MAIEATTSGDLTQTRQSRRGLLVAGAAALAAAAAATLSRSLPGSAADGDSVSVGSTHSGTTTTTFQTTDQNAINAISESAMGLDGQSTSGQGVHGTSSTSAGVAGVSDSGNGVHGQSTSSRGVYGQSTSGPGVEASGAVGLKAEATDATSGYALETVQGRVRFAGISGIATIPAGDTNVVVNPGVEIDNQTFVLISPSENLHENALWYTKQGGNQEILIHINSSRSNDTNVSYLILEHA